MKKVAGLWEWELRRVVHKLQGGGAARVLVHDGCEAIVRVEKIDPSRFGSNAFGY